MKQLQNKHLTNCRLLPTRIDLLEQLPKNLICAEVGVALGAHCQQIYNIMKPKKLYLIDIWKADKIKNGYDIVNKLFKKDSSVNIIKGYSVETLESFPKNTFDYIYIDTSHRYDDTYNELIAASKVLKENGYLSGHDYSKGNVSKSFEYGVIKAVHNFCIEYNWQFVYLTMEISGDCSYCLQRI